MNLNNRSKTIIAVVAVLLISCCFCSILVITLVPTQPMRSSQNITPISSENEESQRAASSPTIPANNIQPDQPSSPSWYNKEFAIDAPELKGLSVQTVQVWPSYEDRSNVVMKLSDKDTFTLIGYRKDYNYCKIAKNDKSGWIDCKWIRNLPELTDY